MARYRLLKPHVVDGALLEAGVEVAIDYEPSLDMEPLDTEGKRRFDTFRLSRENLVPDYPNHGWPVVDRMWYRYMLKQQVEEVLDPAPRDGRKS
jgi:hypothetical protein